MTDETQEPAEAEPGDDGEVEGFTNLNSSRSNLPAAGGLGMSPSDFKLAPDKTGKEGER